MTSVTHHPQDLPLRHGCTGAVRLRGPSHRPDEFADALVVLGKRPPILPNRAATVGWQAQGRSLVASHGAAISPIIATRIYALLGVAQYGAVVDAGKQLDADGILNGDGFGDGGRRRFEAERGAIAAASTQILSYLFPDAATALEQRLSDEGKAGPGGVHPYSREV